MISKAKAKNKAVINPSPDFTGRIIRSKLSRKLNLFFFKNFKYGLYSTMQNFILNFSLNFFISNIILGCKAFGQLKFWYRAFLASGILSVGILAYGIFSILLLAYSILAKHLDWHSPIIITAWTFN